MMTNELIHIRSRASWDPTGCSALTRLHASPPPSWKTPALGLDTQAGGSKMAVASLSAPPASRGNIPSSNAANAFRGGCARAHTHLSSPSPPLDGLDVKRILDLPPPPSPATLRSTRSLISPPALPPLYLGPPSLVYRTAALFHRPRRSFLAAPSPRVRSFPPAALLPWPPVARSLPAPCRSRASPPAPTAHASPRSRRPPSRLAPVGTFAWTFKLLHIYIITPHAWPVHCFTT